ncbi:hypothetical protein [Methylobacterium sp. AMS5]|uniref:hypothetical protein n=1 Tax=Methylobacterium sp. AMS5 TaxID=925818 RepID=UPI00074FA2A1|nr:hypothetical protein [Methylobacterium sp. AMS5]AMB48334.1 hypothetical protein Y590_25535 [Methylobacterium sp. AMS5]
MEEKQFMEFVAALCIDLGGTDLRKDEGFGHHWSMSFLIGKDRVRVAEQTNCGNCGSRVQIGVFPDEIPYYPYMPMGDEYRCAHGKFDITRPVERIVREVQKRILDASVGALANRREHYAAHLEQKSWIVAQEPELQALGFRTERSSDDEELRLHGHGINGRIQPNRTVHVERIGSVSLDKFKRIAAILAE